MILVSVLVTEQMRHVDLNYELGSYKHTIHTLDMHYLYITELWCQASTKHLGLLVITSWKHFLLL